MTEVTEVTGVNGRPGEGRFEVTVGGRTAELITVTEGGRMLLVHTEVPDELAGHGVGGRLVRAALDRAVAQGLTLVPLCPFARHWLEEHPELAGSADIDWSPMG
jgi:predicted GNAT family acetyltransferase